MASRAEPVAGMARPRLDGVGRAALSDFYFHSVRLVTVNVVWGLGAVVVALVALTSPLLAIVLLPALAVPTVAIFRMAARIVRTDGDPTVRQVLSISPRTVGGAALAGTAFIGGLFMLATNAAIGLVGGDPFGWLLGTLAAWGFVALWCFALVAWPLVVDPARAGRPFLERLRSAAAVILAYPVPCLLLVTTVTVTAVLSAVLTVALLTMSLSFVALLACRVVYPLADRLDSATRPAS